MRARRGVALALAPWMLLACAAPAWERPPPPTRDAPVVQPGSLVRAELENGLHVIVLRDRRLPRVSLGVTVRRGEAMIDPERRTPATRLDIVKKVFSEFVERRPSDVIGLTTFARFVEENCPLTLDHDNLTEFVKAIRYASPIEDGTAIGDSLLHAVLTLSRADDIFRTAGPRGQEFTIRSKIIICLTDGQRSAGR